jgi:type II secretory pathway predicted ATPase ExeA
MYDEHWGFTGSPFRSPPAAKFVCLSSTQDEAHARLQFLVEHGRRLGILWGGPGVGKTLLLQSFADQLRRRGCRAIYLTPLGGTGHNFLQELAIRLGLNPDRTTPVWELGSRVLDALVIEGRLGVQRVLMVDDMDRAERSVIDVLLHILQHDYPSTSGFTMLLAGDIQHQDRLDPRLAQRSELRIELEPWNLTETTAYLKEVLARAGCRRPVFQKAAIHRLHEVTGGVPRHVAKLADWALLAAAERQRSEIDEATILAVNDELCPRSARAA